MQLAGGCTFWEWKEQYANTLVLLQGAPAPSQQQAAPAPQVLVGDILAAPAMREDNGAHLAHICICVLNLLGLGGDDTIYLPLRLSG